MAPDHDRRRGGIQEPAADGEQPAARLARLGTAVMRLDSEPTLLSAARRVRRRLPGDVQMIARGVTALRPGRKAWPRSSV